MAATKRSLLASVLLLALMLMATITHASQTPPMHASSYFEGPWEVEPNNSDQQANGPLRSDRAYLGYPNDPKLQVLCKECNKKKQRENREYRVPRAA